MESPKPKAAQKPLQPQKPISKPISSNTSNDWGLDDWGSFDNAPKTNPSASTKLKGSTGTSSVSEGWDDDDWGSLEESSNKLENASPNDWSEDWGEGGGGMSKAELAKKKREERKQQRLQAMKEKKAASRGPAKLGAKIQ